MTIKRNYKLLKYLTSKAKASIDSLPSDNGSFIDYHLPSKERTNAYQLYESKEIIYLDDEQYRSMMRIDWNTEASDKRFYKVSNQLVNEARHRMKVEKVNYYGEDYIDHDDNEDEYDVWDDSQEEDAKTILNEEFYKAVADMGESYEIIVDLILKGYNWTQIANELGITKQAMVKRKHQMQKKLSKLFK